MDSSSLQLKQEPMSIQAEQAVLGSIIIKPSSFDHVGGMLTAEDFYHEDHKKIFATLVEMYSTSKTIDPVTLVASLSEKMGREQEKIVQYIAVISQSVPAVSNIKEYARIVKEKSILRRLIGACEDISEEAYNQDLPVRTVLDSAQQRIFDISNGNETKEFRHIRDILQNVWSDLEILSANKGETKGAKTGFSGLDRVLVEMGRGDLIIVGARPGMGKTSFAMNIATNVAKTGKAVAIFNLEMSAEQLVTRILSSEAMVDSKKLRTGQLKPEDWDNIAGVISSLSGCDIYIDDTSNITAAEMKSKLRRISNLGLVVIDYIGLMQSSLNTDNRAQQVTEISRNLKIMAKDLGIPIVCCAQLNRGTESRTGENKKPTLADLRDSGSIEQDADIVLFLYRDEYYNDIKGASQADGNDGSSANTAEVIIAKNRHGSTGNVKMGWIGQFTKFRCLKDDNRP